MTEETTVGTQTGTKVGTTVVRATAVPDRTGLEVAVIGMAGRFPGAEDVEEFWTNLIEGVDAISRFTPDELTDMGVAPEVVADERFVRAKGVFPGIESFDAGFFGYAPADARLLDPQVRALHEEVFHALEDAGYSGSRSAGAVGLFLGATNNVAWEVHTLRRHIMDAGVTFAGTQLNDKDFAATRIAYALDLTGPAVSLHTACSTSLVAVDMALRSLWTGGCQIALAGGSGLTLPHKNGYVYRENMIHSPDGHCRAFDVAAEGTVEGNGVGVVVLKRLELALRDGDRVHAVIRGSATNNDGYRKIGYTAPSIEGQAEVVRKAHRVARIEASDLSYVEAHGTGTALGDPIEVAALRRGAGEATGTPIALGSVKSNVGHLDTAAGVTALIKTCQVLKHGTAPGTLHFSDPSPALDLDQTPFRVSAATAPLVRRLAADGTELPLRAAVSAFGIGGTNAHVVLEEAPEVVAPPSQASPRRHQTLVLGAASAGALHRARHRLADHLAATPDLAPESVAWTMQSRQRAHPHRYAAAFTDLPGLHATLTESLVGSPGTDEDRVGQSGDVAFLFSGLGAQHLGMARGLYGTEPVFRGHVDHCLNACETFGDDLPRRVFFGTSTADEERLNDIEMTQLLLFLVEYSLARTIMGWGLTPAAMIGHSTGELAAACMAGVFSVEDGLRLVRARGRLMGQTAKGSLVSVKAPLEALRPLLGSELAVAAVNSTEDCTISGAPSEIADFVQRCVDAGLGHTVIDADHAYHSRHMESVLGDFRKVVESIELRAPSLRYVSNVTGDWITDAQATDPSYYCEHVRSTVQFVAGIETIERSGRVTYVEVGPGKALSSFVRTITRNGEEGVATCVNLLRHRMEEVGDDEHLARAVGRLWEAGVALDWLALHGRVPERVSLPLYPFDPTPHPVDVTEFNAALGEPVTAVAPHGAGPATVASSAVASGPLTRQWTRAAPPVREPRGRPRVLMVLTDDAAASRRLLDPVAHWRMLYVTFGTGYQFLGQRGAVVRRGNDDDLAHLCRDLEEHALAGDTVLVHGVDPRTVRATVQGVTRAVTAMREPHVQDVVVLDDTAGLRGEPDVVDTVIGLNLEHPQLRVVLLDVERGTADEHHLARKAIVDELDARESRSRPSEVAIRRSGEERRVPAMVPVAGTVGAPRRAERTVVVCRSRHLADVVQALGDVRDRDVRVVPLHVGEVDEAVGSPAAGSGGAKVLPPVTGPTWEAVTSRLAAAAVDLGTFDAGVLWDPEAPSGEHLDTDLRGRLLLHRRWSEAAARGRARTEVLSRTSSHAGSWTRASTEWLADTGVVDAAAAGTRLLDAGAPLEHGGVLDVLSGLAAAGVATAWLGVDVLDAQARAKEAGADESTDDGSGAAVILEQEIGAVLGIDEVDHRADVFDLGLDSVKLVQLLSSLERRGFKLLASEVHNNPTIRALEALIGRGAASINAEVADVAGAAAVLEERLGVPCHYSRVRLGPDSDESIVLGVEGLDAGRRDAVLALVREMRLPEDCVPHYVVEAARGHALVETGDLSALGLPATLDTDEVSAEIDRLQDELRTSVGAQAVRWTYPVSGVQKHHFAGDARLQLYLIQFRELLDQDSLRRALTDVVGRHGVLRSFLTRRRGRLRWTEFDPPTSVALPVVDLSGLSPDAQESLRDELVRREWTIDLDVLDRPMYQVVLLKYNERSHDLLFQFDHSIFDAASGQVLRSDLLRRYHEFASGTTRAMPAARSYRHLNDQINKGPVGITADGIIEAFGLERWAQHASVIKERSAAYADRPVRHVRFRFDLAGADDDVDPFELTVRLFARLISRMVDVDEVAFDILFQSREYEDVDYSDVMGMVLGSVPVVISGRRGAGEDLELAIRDKFRLMTKHNISFLNLVHDLRSMLRFGKVFSATKDGRGKGYRSTCLLNFVGNVEDEYDAIWDMTLDQLTQGGPSLDYADFYCAAKSNRGALELLVLSRWVEDPAAVVSILDEEARSLTAPTNAPHEHV